MIIAALTVIRIVFINYWRNDAPARHSDWSAGQAGFVRPDDQMHPGTDVQFREQPADVGLHGGWADL
jgi:hypothetical protein